MGNGGVGINCYNSLHASMLGWAKPMETVDAADMRPGERWP